MPHVRAARVGPPSAGGPGASRGAPGSGVRGPSPGSLWQRPARPDGKRSPRPLATVSRGLSGNVVHGGSPGRRGQRLARPVGKCSPWTFSRLQCVPFRPGSREASGLRVRRSILRGRGAGGAVETRRGCARGMAYPRVAEGRGRRAGGGGQGAEKWERRGTRRRGAVWGRSKGNTKILPSGSECSPGRRRPEIRKENRPSQIVGLLPQTRAHTRGVSRPFCS